MPICLIQTNLPTIDLPDDLHVAFSKLIAETLIKPEEVCYFLYAFRCEHFFGTSVAKISAVSRKLVQPKRTVKQNVLRGKMSISTSG